MTFQPVRATITFEGWPEHWGPRPVWPGLMVIDCPDYQNHDPHVWDSMKNYPEETREPLWCKGVTPETTRHIGRSWVSTDLEDECPCPQEPCGLVDRAKVLDSCKQHPPKACKTIRQGHMARNCPGVRPDGGQNPTKNL